MDAYFAGLLTPDEVALTGALVASAAAGPPAYDVSPQGQLLAFLIQIAGATRVLEIGALRGYSMIRMARALPPGGKIVTIEVHRPEQRRHGRT